MTGNSAISASASGGSLDNHLDYITQLPHLLNAPWDKRISPQERVGKQLVLPIVSAFSGLNLAPLAILLTWRIPRTRRLDCVGNYVMRGGNGWSGTLARNFWFGCAANL